MEAQAKSSGLMPRYFLRLTTLQAGPAAGSLDHGFRQGGRPPDSRASINWRVMLSRS